MRYARRSLPNLPGSMTPASVLCLLRAQSSALAARALFAMWQSRSAIPAIPISPPKPSGSSMTNRRSFAAPRSGRSADSVSIGFVNARKTARRRRGRSGGERRMGGGLGAGGEPPLMATLLCFGFGYCAERFTAEFGDKFDSIMGTVRSAERAAVLNAYQPAGMRALSFDGIQAGPELRNITAQAEHVLVSVPPGETADPVLAACGEALAAGRNLRSVVYLSTIGVYGDNGGGWVDEETPPAPVSDRSRWRLAAEQAWQRFGARHGA